MSECYSRHKHPKFLHCRVADHKGRYPELLMGTYLHVPTRLQVF